MIDTRLCCLDCNTDVHVGTGGTSNLNVHCNLKVCKDSQQAQLIQPQANSLLNFFTQKTSQDTTNTTDDSNWRSSGRMRRRIQVDSRCECDTEITAEEKEVGDSIKHVVVKQFGCM